jgi:hypothetical protein
MSIVDQPPRQPTELRPQFSLLTILLVMALAACGITIWQLWRELVPLRVEVRQMRGELGHLSIDDETRPYAIQLHEWENDVWRWRIYLPPGNKYKLYEAKGVFPAHAGISDAKWLEAVKTATNSSRGVFSSVELQGTFSLEAQLSPQGDAWKLVTIPGGGDSVYRFQDNWLSDEFTRKTMVRSHVGVKRQVEFSPDEPILLFHVAKPVITTNPASPRDKHYDFPKDSAEGLVLWLGQ